MTNYHAQSLVYMLLFTGVGLGLVGRFNVVMIPLLAVVVFALQPMRRTMIAPAMAAGAS